MNEFCRAVIDLVKAAITEKKANIPDNFNWEEALKLCDVHTITPMLYYGAQFSGITLPESINNEFFIETFCSIRKEQNQQYEILCIKKAFEENGIDYMFLKGIVLKPLYKKTEMRTMTDADIFIKQEQYDKISACMTELGFAEINESDHEYIWEKKGSLSLELHKRLIPSYDKDYYRYFSDGWGFARKNKGHEYFMSREDTFIYMFVHFAKHYRDAGIGIRYMTDLYLYLENAKDMDKAYIEKALESLKMLTFYNSIMSTLNVWFDNGETSDITEFITTRIINSGLHGTYYNHLVSSALRNINSRNGKGAKFKRFMQIMFPSLKNMKTLYPVLEKAPLLVVWYWPVRVVSALIYKKDNVRAYREEMKIISDENIQHYKEELRYVGIEYEF